MWLLSTITHCFWEQLAPGPQRRDSPHLVYEPTLLRLGPLPAEPVSDHGLINASLLGGDLAWDPLSARGIFRKEADPKALTPKMMTLNSAVTAWGHYHCCPRRRLPLRKMKAGRPGSVAKCFKRSRPGLLPDKTLKPTGRSMHHGW